MPSADSLQNAKQARHAVTLCVLTTFVIAVTELSVGIYFNLISIIAEGLHTAADLLDSGVALFAVIAAARPPDREHPYGHGKFDSLGGMFEGLCVAGSGIWAIYASSRVLFGFVEPAPRPEPPVLLAMIAASVLYLGVSWYVLRVAARTRSPVVYAEGIHLRVHVYVTAGLFVGILLAMLAQRAKWAHAWTIDPTMGLLLGVALVIVGGRIIWTGVGQVIDTALPPAERDKIIAALDEFRDEFIEIHAIRTRQAGTEQHVDIHLVVAGDMSVAAAHDLSHRIEDRVVEALPQTHFLVHVEPPSDGSLRRYDDRGQTGAVVSDEAVPTEGEHDHHHRPDAHQG